MKTVLLNSLGDDTCVRIEFWTSTTQTPLKLCHQLGAVTGLWEHEPTAGIGMPGTIKNELNNVQEELEAALKARKEPLAKHKWMICDRYVGRILDTIFKVTKSRQNFELFDMEMVINSHVMEVVAPFSFDKETHGKIATNKCNEFARSGGDLIKEEEKALTGREDEEVNKNSLSSKDKVESGVYVPRRPPKKPGGKEADEVDITTNISRGSTVTSENTTQAITNLSKNGKVPNIGSMIKEHEVTRVWLLKDKNIK